MQSCWMIFLAHKANSSPRAISSTMVVTYWFIITKTKFLLHQKLPSVSNFHLLISVASIKVMNLLAHRSSWLHLLQVVFFSDNVTKYFAVPLFKDLSVRPKYWSTALLENKRSSTRRVSASANAIKSAKFGSLLLRFRIANTCKFHLSLMCRQSFVIIKHSASCEPRAFQVWLDVTIWHFSKELWNNLNDDASPAFIVGRLLNSFL